MRMSQSSAAEGLERERAKKHSNVSVLSCSLIAYIYRRCLYLSEVTGKDGVIYQIGRLAGCCAVIGWNGEV